MGQIRGLNGIYFLLTYFYIYVIMNCNKKYILYGGEQMEDLKELLHYGKIVYDRIFEKDNVRVRIIKYNGVLYYTEKNPKYERVMNLEVILDCS